jgi:hypothetical protein
MYSTWHVAERRIAAQVEGADGFRSQELEFCLGTARIAAVRLRHSGGDGQRRNPNALTVKIVEPLDADVPLAVSLASRTGRVPHLDLRIGKDSVLDPRHRPVPILSLHVPSPVVPEIGPGLDRALLQGVSILDRHRDAILEVNEWAAELRGSGGVRGSDDPQVVRGALEQIVTAALEANVIAR